MTVDPNQHVPGACRRSDPQPPAPDKGTDLISPVLYEIVMWGFAERNCYGQRVLRRDIQARLDGLDLTERELNDVEGSPLYVGYRCQACWEAAVTLVTYGQHLCAEDARSLSVLPHRFFP